MPRDGQVGYSSDAIDRLVEGFVYDEDRGAWVEAEASWAALRSWVEHYGNVESEGWLEVLDIERAIARLSRQHPAAAVVVILTLFGWEQHEIAEVLRLRTPYARLLDKAKNFLEADLSGRDPTKAYKSTRRKGS